MFCIAYKGRPKAGIIFNPFTNSTGNIFSFNFNFTFQKKVIVISNYKVKSFYEKKTLQLTKLSDSEKRVIILRSHSGSVTQVVHNKLDKQAKLITAAGSGKLN